MRQTLTRASTYGLEAMCVLARHKSGGPMASHDIARDRGIPDRFLLKVLKPLADRRILLSMKGPNGGYRMGRPAGSISVLEVIEAIDGVFLPNVPTTEGEQNRDIEGRLETICTDAARLVRNRLGKATIADLAAEEGGVRPKASGKAKRRTGKRAKARA